jgi:hypothetical protein
MTTLTNEEIAELEAVRLAEEAIGHPTSVYKAHWRGSTGRLSRMGLLTWKRGGWAWGDDFREVGLTEAGKAALDAIPAADRRTILEAEMAKYDDAA